MPAATEDASKEKNDGGSGKAAQAGGGEKGGSGNVTPAGAGVGAIGTAGASLGGGGKRDTDVEMTAADGTDEKRNSEAAATTGTQDQIAAPGSSLSGILSRESRELLDNPDTRAFNQHCHIALCTRTHTIVVTVSSCDLQTFPSSHSRFVRVHVHVFVSFA